MRSQLPTLKGLQAFEAAYRARSYTKAARTLNVRQPAISYQIKRLEADLGAPLFVKKHGRLAPTPQADALFETLSNAFDSIRRTSESIRRMNDAKVMTIATYSGVAAYWLTPKLARLGPRLKAKMRIVTLVNDAELAQEDADCWILAGRRPWPGFEAKLLIKEIVCPVASPTVVAQLGEAGSTLPSGVAIIEQEDRENRWLNWDDWRAQSGETNTIKGEKITVVDHGLALHMAISGAGLTLGWLGILGDLLASGALVRASQRSVSSEDAGYWLVGPPGFFNTCRGGALYGALIAPEKR